jgi:hypothetical protein
LEHKERILFIVEPVVVTATLDATELEDVDNTVTMLGDETFWLALAPGACDRKAGVFSPAVPLV